MLYRKVEIRNSPKNRAGLFAGEDIGQGARILDFQGKMVPETESGEHDLQTGRNRFIRSPPDAPDNYINHSCEPNAFIKKSGNRFFLVSIKPVKKGDEITFDYDTTDYDNSGLSFACGCESPGCRKLIRGFAYLKEGERKKLEKYLLPHLRQIFLKGGKISGKK